MSKVAKNAPSSYWDDSIPANPDLSFVEKIKRLNLLVELMEWVKEQEKRTGKRFYNQNVWQENYKTHTDKMIKDSLKAMHTCGTQCCISGWVAIDPDFKKLGATVNKEGAMVMDGWDEEDAFVRMFGIDRDEARRLVIGDGRTITQAINMIKKLRSDVIKEAREEIKENMEAIKECQNEIKTIKEEMTDYQKDADKLRKQIAAAVI